MGSKAKTKPHIIFYNAQIVTIIEVINLKNANEQSRRKMRDIHYHTFPPLMGGHKGEGEI